MVISDNEHGDGSLLHSPAMEQGDGSFASLSGNAVIRLCSKYQAGDSQDPGRLPLGNSNLLTLNNNSSSVFWAAPYPGKLHRETTFFISCLFIS